MRGKAINIREILAAYFKGVAGEEEVKIAENYLMLHPEIMEDFAAENSLSLTPEDNQAFDITFLLREEKEYDDYQFQLLAAAASEEDLSGEQLADFNGILASGEERSIIAGEISLMRLRPEKEKWNGKRRALRTPVFGLSAERAIVVLLSAAATLALVLLLKPTLTGDISTQTLSSSLAAEMKPQVAAGENTFVISASVPARKESSPKESASSKEGTGPGIAAEENATEQQATIREEMTITATAEAAILRIDPENPGYLVRVKSSPVAAVKSQKIINNWMITGITSVAFSLAEERRIKDPVDFAGKRIDEINRLLGWEMQLKKEMDKNGDLKAVSFQSGLLCFSTPVKNK